MAKGQSECAASRDGVLHSGLRTRDPWHKHPGFLLTTTNIHKNLANDGDKPLDGRSCAAPNNTTTNQNAPKSQRKMIQLFGKERSEQEQPLF